MFCVSCGQEVEASARFCNACGKAIGEPRVAAPPSRVSAHLNVLVVLWIVYSCLRALAAIWLVAFGRFFLPGLFRSLPIFSEGFPFSAMAAAALTTVGILSLIFAAAGIIAAWGLAQKERWARILAIAIAIISLIRIPVGTALGIYTLWVLLPASSQQEYERLVRPT